MKSLSAVAFFSLTIAVLSAPVPKDLLDPSRKPPILDLSAGTEHQLIAQVKVDKTTYFLVEQQPRLGDWSYVLIAQVDGGQQPKFLAAGAVSDVLKSRISAQWQVPAPALRAMAKAVVAREIGPEAGMHTNATEPGTHPTGTPSPQFRKQLQETWKELPESMREEYKRRGLSGE